MKLINPSRNHRYPLINRSSTRRPWQSRWETCVRGLDYNINRTLNNNNRRSADFVFERFVLWSRSRISMRNLYGCVCLFVCFFLIWSSTLTTVWADLYSKACSNTKKYPPRHKMSCFYGLIKSRMAIYRSTTLTYVPILDFSPIYARSNLHS